MVYQPLESRIPALDAHAKVVSAQYRKALANLEFYPAKQKAEIGDKLSGEYDNFYKAIELARSGVFVREIQEQVCSEARSWVKGNIPAAIAQYSFYQISKTELAERSSVSVKQIKACRVQMNSALDTIAKLRAYDGVSRAAETKVIKQEFNQFKLAFNLYARGFSFKEIKAITNESIQTRVEDKTIPETIMRYSGYPLTDAAQDFRTKKCEKLKASVLVAFEEAKTQQSKRNPSALNEHIEVWQAEVAAFNLVVDLYQKGLTTASIASLTDTPADGWLMKGQLPVKLARAGLDLTSRDFRIPAQLDENFAYVVGAMYANTRVFSAENGIVFRSSDISKLGVLKQRFERVFQTSLVDPGSEQDSYVVRVGKSALIKEIFDRLGIEGRVADPLPPFALLKYSDACRGFVQGYLDFCRPYINIEHNRFGVARSTQPNILKALAVALYLENIYPIVREGPRGVALVIANEEELKKMCKFAPNLLTDEDRVNLARRPKAAHDPLGSLKAYQQISATLESAYPEGERLNFHKLLELSGIEVSSNAIATSIKSRIINWRNGGKPRVALRAEALERLLTELYPGQG